MENSPDKTLDQYNGSEIAIIGMTCRFPGAENVDTFWKNLRDGVESISFLKDDEIELAGLDASILSDPNYVKAASILEDADMFDASFFGFTPREAETMDPQHRLFLECAWEALENAGYDPERYAGAIGVYSGARTNTYLFNLITNRELIRSLGAFEIGLGNDLAFLSTRASYKLNLRGPSYSVHTACSTSLVAVHLACQSLLIDECQIALAGCVAVNVPQKTGYLYQHGGITSSDGHTRTFDAESQGTLFGSGIGVVVLKRLEDALADGDNIHAIIKGSATNNEGSFKASFTAPSVYGQKEVILEALLNAGVDAETITYLEAHGTGTALGDPIEVRALTRAFEASTDKKQFCAIGSVKTNFGHLDAAAGVASLIKTSLSLKHKLIPPSLHFQSPNPKIDFQNSPFYVNTQLAEWNSPDSPRRAGVSAFGVGGTNAHVILEEAPEAAPSSESRRWQLLVLSARTETALDQATANLAAHLKANPEVNLADVAYTLQVGRKGFTHRRAAVCESLEDAVSVLESADPQRLITGFEDSSDRQVVFMFPGGGAQYVGMGAGLYESEPVFKQEVDACCEILKPWLGYDIRQLIYPDEQLHEQSSQRINQTSVALPALFTIEYALAKLWMSWGVRPAVMIGHSMGEYTAACVAGVFSLEDALWLVVNRGKLFEELERGSMLSVSMTEQEAKEMMSEELSIAAINTARQCVVSGREEAIEGYARELEKRGKEYRRIHIEVAAHSGMVEPILGRFEQIVEGMNKAEPKIEMISNVTGKRLTGEEARSARYWRRQLRETVRFGEGIEEIKKEWGRVMLEVGPGHTLSTLVKMGGEEGGRGEVVIKTMRHPYERQGDEEYVREALGKVWMSGVGVDWEGYYAGERRRRVELPTYPFERQRYWIEAGEGRMSGAVNVESREGKKKEIGEWYYIESWKRSLGGGKKKKMEEEGGDESIWLVMDEEGGIGEEIVRRMREGGKEVARVRRGERYEEEEGEGYRLREGELVDYEKMMRRIEERGKKIRQVVHLWGLGGIEDGKRGEEIFEREQRRLSYSVMYVGQALMKEKAIERVRMSVVTRGAVEVESEDEVRAEKATVLGVSKVIEQESGNIEVRVIDIGEREGREREIEEIGREIGGRGEEAVVAYRGGRRSVQGYERVKMEGEERELRERGVYVIVGGLGGVGMILGEYLAKEVKARLVLVGRRGLPEREEWGRIEEEEEGEESREKRLIRRIRSMEEAGGEVIVKRAEVSNEEEMREVIEETHKRYGALNGVIYAAGVTSGSSLFNQVIEIGRDDFEVQYKPKVYGVYVLERVLRGRDIDFCLLFSSNASVLGGLGFVTYSAANSFLDAFAKSQSKKGEVPWISASWDPWPEETKKYTGVQTSMDRYTMTVEESTEAFRRVVTMIPSGHVVVATGDLQARLDIWIKRKLGEDQQAGSVSSSYSRPNLQSAYIAPRDETEQAVVNMWQTVLGIEKVGINDNFFDLGGHSLLATRLVAQLRDTFQIDLPLRRLFETPTAAGLAQAIAELQAKESDQQDQELLEMLSGLSEDEAEMEIKKMTGPAD